MREDRLGPLAALNRGLAALLRALLVVAVAVLVIPVSLQIVSRYTALIPAYIWTEEMARFLFIWAIMLGAVLGVREGNHLVVDLWPPGGARRRALLDIVANLAIAVMAFVFLVWGWRFTEGALYRINVWRHSSRGWPNWNQKSSRRLTSGIKRNPNAPAVISCGKSIRHWYKR